MDIIFAKPLLIRQQPLLTQNHGEKNEEQVIHVGETLSLVVTGLWSPHVTKRDQYWQRSSAWHSKMAENMCGQRRGWNHSHCEGRLAVSLKSSHTLGEIGTLGPNQPSSIKVMLMSKYPFEGQILGVRSQSWTDSRSETQASEYWNTPKAMDTLLASAISPFLSGSSWKKNAWTCNITW